LSRPSGSETGLIKTIKLRRMFWIIGCSETANRWANSITISGLPVTRNGLLVGILEILLGFWASQQYRPVQGALLLIWVGFFALFRGISEIVIAFELRRAQHP
jgi:uncharacterized membrane protein HdeD (DUF308 family)